MVQIEKVTTPDISIIALGTVFPITSTKGINTHCSVAGSGFTTEDSTWEIVEFTLGNVGGNEDYIALGASFLGANDLVIAGASTTHKQSNIGLRLVAKGLETTGILTVTAVIKE